MKKDLFDFSDFDDSIVENIAEKYSDMDKSEQKALCGKVRKRLDMTENSTFADTVSGVEPAKKPILRYIFGTAAAAVFALAVIPLAFKALKNAPDTPENIQESQIITDYNASPTENEDDSTEAVTTKIGESDIIAEITAPQPPTDETTAVLPTAPEKSKDAEDKEEAERTEAPPAPPVTKVKKTTGKLHATVPQAPTVPTAPPKTTKPVTTTTKAVTAPPAPPAISEDGIFNTLANLSYSPYTCDGIADYILTAEDGTTYQILTGCKHVWRNGSEEADITPEILEWVKKYGAPYKIKEYNATAEIDWRYYDFGGFKDYDDGLVDGVWNENTSGNLIITNTTDFCDSLSDVYSENQIKEYTDKYNNDFFDNNVLLIYYKCIPNGRDDKIYMDNIEVSDNEININATYKITGRTLLATYVCVIHVTVPKDIYNEQEIYWNISEQFKYQ